MLDENKTQEKFGYSSDSLTKGSHKRVCIICDYCGETNDIMYKSFLNNKELVNKDACKKCRSIKNKEVCFAKYGVENVSQLESVKKKMSEKSKAKFKKPGYKEKVRETYRKKYGVDHMFQSKEIRDKIRQTSLEKHGHINPGQSKEAKEKSKKTCLEKYGNEYYLGSEAGREKSIQGCLDKYGVEYGSQTEAFKEKCKATNIERYGVDNPLKNKEISKKAAQNSLKSKIELGQIQTYNGKTVPELAEDSKYSLCQFRILCNKYGFEAALQMQPNISSLEQVFKNWLDKENIEYKQQVYIGKKFADFVIDNIAIELDGLYWHSEKVVGKDYHIEKRKIYIEHNYYPLFFREDEVNNKFPIVKSIILNKLNKSNKIFARKCELKEIDTATANQYFEENHLMGKGAGRTFALLNDGEIVSAIRVKKIKDGHEVSRFCHRLNTSVTGAFSKLIKFSREKVGFDNLITFIDLRYGSGEYLLDLGFTYVGEHPSFKWTDGINTYHRMNFPGNEGLEMGMNRIWDCGQAKYVAKFDNADGFAILDDRRVLSLDI